jgi:serine/threonine protein kinase
MGSGFLTQSSTTSTFAPNPVSLTFGRYRLFERIGAGGMAEVFRAVALGPENFQRTLVIKRILPHLSQDLAFVQMFIDEAKVSGLLSHPNLVQIFEFGKVEESFFIAMEHVHGRTLAATQKAISQQNRVMPVPAATEIARQLCTGLEYAHSLRTADGQLLGIVHRDVTPSNLMLSFHGTVKILDFGIARVADGLRHTQTQVGALKGKVSYMSPEQIQLNPVDHRSDIFSLGTVLHEMLAGRRLFRADSDIRTSRMILDMPIQPPSLFNAAVPPALDRIVLRALARDVEARYQSAAAMATDLEQVMLEERMSPREHIKMLHQLFPHEAMMSADAGVLVPTAGGKTPEAAGERPTPPRSVDTGGLFAALDKDATKAANAGAGALDAVDVSVSESGLARWMELLRGRGRRGAMLVGALSLAVVAAIVLTVGHRRGVAPVSEAAAAPSATNVPGRRTSETRSVRCSLDSTPQDATIVRVDSGAIVGKTPATIALPQGDQAVTFRFEKAGYRVATSKVIPDLDKSLRIDLLAEAGQAETLDPTASAGSRRTLAHQASPHNRAGHSTAAKRTGGGKDTAQQFRSATPVNPFDM